MRHPILLHVRREQAGQSTFHTRSTRAAGMAAFKAVRRRRHLYQCQKLIRGTRILDGLGAAERPETVGWTLPHTPHRLNRQDSRGSKAPLCLRPCSERLRGGR